MIKLVAFDWNGTLLADTKLNWECGNINFKRFGYKPITLKRFRETFDIPVSKFWLANGGKAEDLKKQGPSFHEIYEARISKSRMRAGSKELLKWLERRHIKRMIFSNHITPDIIRQLLRLDIHQYFDEILARPAGEHSQVHSRTKDRKLHDYVKRNKLKPGEVLVIGDTEEEIDIGKKYGFYTVAITGGYNSAARLGRLKPDYLINKLSEFQAIIKKLNAKR